MTHTKSASVSFSLLRALTTAFLIAGISFVVSSQSGALAAQLSDAYGSRAGTTLLDRPAQAPGLLPAPRLHLAAADLRTPSDVARMQILLGMILILAGFATHLIYVLRHERLPKKEGGPYVTTVRIWFRECLDRHW